MREWTSSRYRGVEYEFTLFFSIFDILIAHSSRSFDPEFKPTEILSLLGKHV